MGIKHVGKQGGFTLVEVAVSVGIFCIISAVMLSFFIQGTALWHLVINQSDARSVARNAMNYLTRELQNATRTSNLNPHPNPPNLVIPSKPNNTSVDFYLPVDNDDNGFIIDAIGDTEWDLNNKIQYQYVPGLKILRRLEKGNQYIIVSNVSSIEFEDKSINPALYNNEVKIILTLKRAIQQNRTIFITLTSIVKLRNQ
ncbi:MAG: prepilin-type N-terminal cleavage/methylation domain-containing protein [Candidatus Omnitrophota bacterium]